MNDYAEPPVIADGYHPDLPRAVYDAIPALNYSVAKHGLKSMEHLRHAQTHPREMTDALRLGIALHLAVFEPGRFASEIGLVEKVDGRTKEGKAAKAKQLADNADKLLTLDEDEYGDCKGMASKLLSHPDVVLFMAQPGHCEPSCVWTDEQTGVRLKSRLDRYAHAVQTLVDVKSTKDASPRGWPREVAHWDYHLQAAWYTEAIKRTRGEDIDFYWACVENEAPYSTAFYSIDLESLEQGQKDMRAIIDQYAACLKSGVWTGYPTDVVLSSGLPVYRLERSRI